jgi:phosphoglycolate phosphatase
VEFHNPGVRVPPLRSHIGPPIRELLRKLLQPDEPTLARWLAEFRRCYDSEGWRNATLYDGAEQLLHGARKAGVRLFVVTNKPGVPTRKILEHFRLFELFDAIYSPDYQTPAFRSKTESLAHLIAQYGLNAARCLMAGDSIDDATAARETRVDFCAASYGYGTAASDRSLPKVAVAGAFREIWALLRHNESLSA